MRFYRYVGPPEIAAGVGAAPVGAEIRSPADVLAWARRSGSLSGRAPQGCFVTTFVVDARGILRIADQRSEHVACAGGGPVQAAGEMTFEASGEQIVVSEATNQSTGYCPEPESWSAVDLALARAGLIGPATFTRAFDFRRCPQCRATNLVKDDVWECSLCGSALPSTWNFEG